MVIIALGAVLLISLVIFWSLRTKSRAEREKGEYMQGLEVFDANGKPILRTSDRIGKIRDRHDFWLAAHERKFVNITVPALTHGQSRLVIIQQRYGSIPLHPLDRYGVYFDFTSFQVVNNTTIRVSLANSNRSGSTVSVYVGAI